MKKLKKIKLQKKKLSCLEELSCIGNRECNDNMQSIDCFILRDTNDNKFLFFKLSFQNQHTVYENYITAHVKENEFNLSYNPSLRTTSSNAYSEIKNFATGSLFHPYATTIGFYNDDNELLKLF